MHRTSDEWLQLYIKHESFLQSGTGENDDHFILRSGVHSRGYFNSTFIMEDPVLCTEACTDLLELLYGGGVKPDRVIGSAYGAIYLAGEMARLLGTKRGFTEKVEGHLKLRRSTVSSGEVIRVVEDAITLGGSVAETIGEILSKGGVVLPEICVVVNRSGSDTLTAAGNEYKIISLIKHELPVSSEATCRDCINGSRAIQPKVIA